MFYSSIKSMSQPAISHLLLVTSHNSMPIPANPPPGNNKLSRELVVRQIFPSVLSSVGEGQSYFVPQYCQAWKKAPSISRPNHSSPPAAHKPRTNILAIFLPIHQARLLLLWRIFLSSIRTFLLRFSLASYQSQWQLKDLPVAEPLVYQGGEDTLWGNRGERWGKTGNGDHLISQHIFICQPVQPHWSTHLHVNGSERS